MESLDSSFISVKCNMGSTLHASLYCICPYINCFCSYHDFNFIESLMSRSVIYVEFQHHYTSHM
ncbi:hypothetical protein V1478_012500 [Vespula squamosa]|uniref:Uncharacterized protein n=1 Tax=Vespula squamosa TaxID=30214 RepID=A0ABD2ADC5_VESSQ